jgi:hypothetical protein
MLVPHLGNEFQLMLDLRLHLGGNAILEAAMGADIGFLAQERRGRVPGRHHFIRIFIAQFIQRKSAQAGDTQRLGQCLGRIDIGQADARTQVLLGVLRQAVAALGHGFAQPHCSERVLQGFTRAHMHRHMAQRHDRQAVLPPDFIDGGAVAVVVSTVQQVQAQPATPGKGAGHPRGLGMQAVQVVCAVAGIGRQQDRQAVAHAQQVLEAWPGRVEIGGRQQIRAFLGARARQRDQFGQIAITVAVLRQQYQRQRMVAVAAGQVKMGADE